ncbi:MAG TPA: alpha-glucan family phosphorylase [Steroidobacteraceae bacterium]|nr:alpha-glucan family phosphorylase [Steroidobacteraceae bacterium]
MIRAPSNGDHRHELVAYFCAEYAVDERLPIYAGGLGVLAGDHLKTAGDMELPLVAVGLLYGGGYFTQRLDAEGGQQAIPARFDPQAAGLAPVLDPMRQELRIPIPMAGAATQARLWRKDVGPIPLFLLDTDVEENSEEDRGITSRLYDAGHDARLKQEIVLGIGGVRAIRALGLRPSVWHINEGHAAFMALERMRERIAWGHSFGAALETVAAATVFTTHTPVAAGHDVFSYGQLRHFLGTYLGALHVPERRLFALGANTSGDDRFNMTALAMRCSRHRNAVSRVHRGVAARMESYVWPQVPPEESPIGYVTNGVHLPTFAAPAWREFFDQRLPGWRRRVLSAGDLVALDTLDDGALRALRAGLRISLVRTLCDRLAAQHRRNGLGEERLAPILAGLEAAERGAPVMGFARRFAPYKRATLLLQDAPRLARLLDDPARPALLVFAGKAHPRDGGGQQLIRELYAASLQPEFAGRLLVVEDYDLDLARRLVQGCDIWLNTPEYPLEASGTSGMKSAANGGVNVSVLDGWWAEAFDGDNGFGIEPVLDVPHEERNRREAELLFETLERQVIPEYYGDAGETPSPAWLRRARRSARTALSRFSSLRMLDEYRNGFYSPAAHLAERVRGRRGKAAVNLARWRRLVQLRWPGVRLEPRAGAAAGATVITHGIPAESIAVEAELGDGTRRRLALAAGNHEHAEFGFPGESVAGIRAYRAWPEHELLAHPYELGLMLRVEAAADSAA